VREQVGQLPGARVATWGGFIFINPDPEAIPLADFMGPEMIDHYAKYRLENRYKQVHVRKIVRANWKLAMEAFTESYHVFASHPQLLLEGRDFGDSHYDVFGNWARLGHVQSCVASAMRGLYPSQEQVLAAYRGYADFMKSFLRTLIGDEVEQFSDAELNDVSYSNLFPNFSPWGGFMRLVYRWRPHGDDPDESIMEVMLLTPWPEGKPKPPPAAVQELGPDESWTKVRQLGAFARVADQDLVNLSKVQRGLKTKQPPTVWFSAYQEGGIRNWHRIYDEMMGLDRP
jgi:phenylpropionate dioxygenase-like ring-hydroxylating dioxygenase large terminal subunit